MSTSRRRDGDRGRDIGTPMKLFLIAGAVSVSVCEQVPADEPRKLTPIPGYIDSSKGGAEVTAASMPIDDRPDLVRELTYIRLEYGRFHTTRLLSRAIEEQLAWWRFRIEEKNAKTLWIRAETKAFARLTGDLQKELDRTTKTRNDLREASLEAARFVNGNSWRGFRHAFIKLLQMVGHTSTVRSEMERDVPSLPASDFELHRFGGLVEANGELKAPPPSMLAESRAGSGQVLFDLLRSDWALCAADLAAAREIPPRRLAQMDQTVEEWRRFVEETYDVPGPSSLSYLDRCDELVETLASPGSSLVLAGFLKNRGHAFPGGTAGDLLQYVLDNDLVPRAGTRGHLALATVADELFKKAKTETAVLDRRLEELKAQSPAHNAAVRQRLVPETFGGSFSGTHAGIDSPAYTKPTAEEKRDDG